METASLTGRVAGYHRPSLSWPPARLFWLAFGWDSGAGGGEALGVFCGQAHPFERTRPFGVVATALDLGRRSPDPRRAAIGALLAGQGAGAPASAAGDIQYRVVEWTGEPGLGC